MKKLFIIIPIFLLLTSAFIFFKSFQPKENIMYLEAKPTPTINTSLPSGSEKIEIFAFHSTQRCISCINVGKYTQEVVGQQFAPEVALGKIIFKEINIDLAENRQLAKDYQITGSSLFITVTKDNQTFKEEDTTVWRLVTNEVQIKSYLESKIKKLL